MDTLPDQGFFGPYATLQTGSVQRCYYSTIGILACQENMKLHSSDQISKRYVIRHHGKPRAGPVNLLKRAGVSPGAAVSDEDRAPSE